MRKIIYSLLFCLLSSSITYGQSKSVKAGLESSSQIGIGYENRFAEGWAVWFQGGLATLPFNIIAAQGHQLFGATKEQTDLVKENYKLGMVLSLGGQYYFSKQTRRNYIGPVFQWYRFQKADIKDPLIENYFDVDLSGPDFPLGPISQVQSTEPLTLTHSKLNTGFIIGRRIEFSGIDELELHLEFSITKTINSNSVIESDYRILSLNFQDRVNNEINEMYRKHGFLPSFNAYIIYKISYTKF